MTKIDIQTCETLLKPLVTLIHNAGEVIKKYYGQDILVMQKKDGSPVTIGDEKANDIIVEGIRTLLPSVTIISEEGPMEERAHADDPFWLIDPLDGTAGFIQKTGAFVTNIALIQDQKPILGVIHLPLTGVTYIGSRKVFRIEGDVWQELSPPLKIPESIRAIVGGHSAQDQLLIKNYLGGKPMRSLEVLGSALKFCRLLENQADLYVRHTSSSEWDTAAGHALINAYGGTMMTLDHQYFLYGKPHFKNPGFVVYGRKDLWHSKAV